MKVFDAHCHLPKGGIDSMLERATAAGVEAMAVCGTNSKDWVYCIDAHRKFQGLENPALIYPMLGIHPWFVGCRAGAVTPPETAITRLRQEASTRQADRGYSWKEDFQTLEKIVRADAIGETGAPMLSVGVGECGLDFSSFAKATADRQDKFQNRAEQEACFRAHLELARELNRPVAIHCVQAWGKLLEILREFPEPKKILHAFSGAAELIPELAELNGWFSFGDAVMNPKFKRAREAAAAVPAERLLIETDSEGEPDKLIDVARAVAELRGVPVEAIAELTFDNAQPMFF